MSAMFPTHSLFIHYGETFDHFLFPVTGQTLRPAGGGEEPIDLISLTKGLLGRLCEHLGAEPAKINEGELAAFLSYAIAYPGNFLPVIDSYSVAW